MHGIGAEPGVDRVRPDDFGGHAGIDIFLSEAPGGVLGQEQFSNLALRIGQRRCNRMPAIENYRPVGATVAVPPRSGGRAVFGSFRRVCRRHGGTAVFGRDRSWASLVLHGFPIMANSGALDLCSSGGFRWLTLPWRFAHKRARPGARHRLTV